KVDDVVKASETGALGAGTSSPKVRANKAPVVTVEGEKTRTVKVGQRLSITTLVTDDGVPRAFTEAELTQAFVARARAASAAAAARLPGEGAGGRGAAAPSGGAAAGSGPAAAPPSAARFNPAMLPPTRV